ncbi:Chitooligosaccharide deacetylase [Rhodovastum atsumiense]|uniref:Chitooligosaccharide deacetylase n=1 Tax=Rhodovastum atsumiense TaxID=504468 RepID=A0A5M6J1D0_9PROT|nr:polysaccharide deacetylase family protein [Rhodovastum atsumiense]KAA5614314.1 polysaccharide deacetylase family protein [Rhodovastum atsumiense]CAH2604776.1 Chitooligosaccharide deacetylase [Rhodovastum atsumiense]
MAKFSWTGAWLPVIHRLPAPPAGQKAVALTIDDGPTEVTPQLLDILARAGAQAAFFLSGARLAPRPEAVDAILAGGHQVYAHGFEHVRLDGFGRVRLHADMTACETMLARFRPTPSPYLVRLPYAAGRRLPHVHSAIRAWRRDAQIAHWSLSAEDHTIAGRCTGIADVDRICDETVARMMASPHLNGSVILLHDIPHDVDSPFLAPATVTLLRKLIEALVAGGYALVPLRPLPSPTLLSRFVLEK